MSVFFNVTLNNHAFTQKPTHEEVTWNIRPYFHNRIRTLNIFEFKNYIEEGYSFYATVLDYRLNTAKKIKDPSKPTVHLNRTCFVAESTTLLSVDVDHGNFTVDELHEILGDLPFALIYKTFSYTEEKRKYRVLFIANRPFKDEEEYRYTQLCLIYLFAKPFLNKIETLESKVDFSVRDVSRISFAGTPIETEVYDRTFDLDAFLELQNQQNTTQLIEEYLSLWKQEKKRRNKELAKELGLVSEKKTKTKTKTKSKEDNKEEEVSFTKEDIFCTLVSRLKDYSVEMKLSERRIDFLDTIGFINEIPLTYLLSEEVYQPFCCKLPYHIDKNPSANILLDDDGSTRYYCASCHDLHALSTFDFVEEVIHAQLGFNRYQVIKMVFEILNVPLHSQYQTQAIMGLLENDRFLTEWDEEDELYKRLVRKGLMTLWVELNQIAKLRTPLQPLTKDKNQQHACFFASTRNIYETMARKRRMEKKYNGGAYRGFNDHAVTNRKINELVKYGLIHKIKEADLEPAFLIRSQEIRDIITKQEERQEKTLIKRKKDNKERHIDYYEIPVVNPTLLKKALEMILLEKEYGVKAKGRSMKQVIATYGIEKAEQIYTQCEVKLNKKDETFLKRLNQAIDLLLDKQGYFNEKQLISKIDPKGNLFKTKEVYKDGQLIKKVSPMAQKRHKTNQFLGGVCVERGLVRVPVNKHLRKQFNLPESIVSNSVIYIPKESTN